MPTLSNCLANLDLFALIVLTVYLYVSVFIHGQGMYMYIYIHIHMRKFSMLLYLLPNSGWPRLARPARRHHGGSRHRLRRGRTQGSNAKLSQEALRKGEKKEASWGYRL